MGNNLVLLFQARFGDGKASQPSRADVTLAHRTGDDQLRASLNLVGVEVAVEEERVQLLPVGPQTDQIRSENKLALDIEDSRPPDEIETVGAVEQNVSEPDSESLKLAVADLNKLEVSADDLPIDLIGHPENWMIPLGIPFHGHSILSDFK